MTDAISTLKNFTFEHKLLTLNKFSEYHTKGKETFTYAKEVSKPYGSLDNLLSWCKLETRSEWAWQLVEPGRYIFYFVNEQDYFAFIIKWC